MDAMTVIQQFLETKDIAKVIGTVKSTNKLIVSRHEELMQEAAKYHDLMSQAKNNDEID